MLEIWASLSLLPKVIEKRGSENRERTRGERASKAKKMQLLLSPLSLVPVASAALSAVSCIRAGLEGDYRNG